MNKADMKYFTFDNIYKVVSLLGIMAVLWLNTNYVTRREFETFSKEQIVLHTKLGDSINQINISLQLLQENKIVLADHEQRIRILEKESKN